MRKKFDEQLAYLNQKMIQMGTMIERNIQLSIEALLKQDESMARKIMEQDEEVDKMQKDIEGICFSLLISQQPVARDLRTITAAMKMVTDMERIGDHAADISEMTILLSKDRVSCEKNLKTVTKMASEAMQMLIDSIEAFVGRDVKKAEEVIFHDDVVDNLFVEVKQELITMICDDPKHGEQEMDILMIAKYLERIADHATNISEWVIYAAE